MSMVSQDCFSNNAAAVASLVLPHSQSPNPRSDSTTFFHDFKAIRLSVSRKFPSFATSRLNRNRHFSSFPILMASVDDKLISSPHQALSSESPEAIGLQGTAWQSSMANKEPPNNVGGLARGTVIYPVRFPHEARMLFPIFEVFGSVLLRLSSAVVVVISAPSETLDASSSGIVGANDLMIVGPGVLGRLVAEKWREEHPGCQIFGQTVTSDHHAELIEMGIKPSVKGTQVPHKFPYVIFCAPPSQTSDYAGDIREAASNWSGEGSFLFTSSSAPYDCNDNGSCDEDSPAVPIGRSPRTDVLLKSEKVVLEAGGCVVRLAGLYKADRGAHVYWLSKGTSDVRPDHIINLIHYEDAASLSVVILKKKLRSRIFLGCDNHPLSRQEVMDLVERSGKFSKKFQGFTGTSDPLGKKLNNSKTRAELGWEPKYPSFAQFLGVS